MQWVIGEENKEDFSVIEIEKNYYLLCTKDILLKVLGKVFSASIILYNEKEKHSDTYYTHPRIKKLQLGENNLSQACYRVRNSNGVLEAEIINFTGENREPITDEYRIKKRLTNEGYSGDFDGGIYFPVKQGFEEVLSISKIRDNLIIIIDQYKTITISYNTVQGLIGAFLEIEILTDPDNNTIARKEIALLEEQFQEEGLLFHPSLSYGELLLSKNKL